MEKVMGHSFVDLMPNELLSTNGGKIPNFGDWGYKAATGWLNFWDSFGGAVYDVTHLNSNYSNIVGKGPCAPD